MQRNEDCQNFWFISTVFIISLLVFGMIGLPVISTDLSSEGSQHQNNAMPYSGILSNGICSYSVVNLANPCYQTTTSGDHTNLIQYAHLYYNSTYGLLFYILDSKVNAQNGANIIAGNHAYSDLNVKSTIYNSINSPGYISYTKQYYCSYIVTGNLSTPFMYFGGGGRGGTLCCKEVPSYHSYGHLCYGSPNGQVNTGQYAQVTVSTELSAGVNFCGVSIGGKVGTTYSYNLYNFCMNVQHEYTNNDQWFLKSFDHGQTYAHFVTSTMVHFQKGYNQYITFGSIGNTTYTSPGWFCYPTLRSSTASLSCTYTTPNLLN
jgi:hypothetical protein